MGLLSLLPANPGLTVANMATNTNGSQNRITVTGDWYVPSTANVDEFTMILSLVPSVPGVRYINSVGGVPGNQYAPGVSWICGKGCPCFQLGQQSGANVSNYAPPLHADANLGITLQTSTYYRLTGWIEWREQAEQSGGGSPDNGFYFGWKLQTITGNGGNVIDTLADISWADPGHVGLDAIPVSAKMGVIDDMAESQLLNYRQYRVAALSYSMSQSAGLWDTGYASNPASTDGFSTAVLNTSPTFFYRLMERYGSKVWDLSPNANHGNYWNSWNYGGYIDAYDVQGAPGGAIPGTPCVANFHGNDNTVFGVQSNQKLDTTAFTIQIAVNAFSWSNNTPRLVASGHTDTSNNGVEISYNAWDNGTYPFLEAAIGNGSSYYTCGMASTATALSTDTWYLIHLTYDGTTLTLYLNGSSVGSVATSGTATAGGNNLMAGYNPSYNGGAFNGKMQDFAYWAGTALTATQITDLYNAWTSAGAA